MLSEDCSGRLILGYQGAVEGYVERRFARDRDLSSTPQPVSDTSSLSGVES